MTIPKIVSDLVLFQRNFTKQYMDGRVDEGVGVCVYVGGRGFKTKNTTRELNPRHD